MSKEKELLGREELLRVMRAAMDVQAYRFAEQSALSWLSAFPGDLEMLRTLAAVWVLSGRREQAFDLLNRVCATDPLNVYAWRAMAQICRDWKPVEGGFAEEALSVLQRSSVLPAWAIELNAMRVDDVALVDWVGRWVKTDGCALQAVELLQKFWRADGLVWEGWEDLLLTWQERWPMCTYFRFGLAELLIRSNEEAQAVNLLHRCVADDVVGHAARSWWGDGHPYLALWPMQMEIVFLQEAPAEVQAKLGKNWLPGGEQIQDGAIERKTIEVEEKGRLVRPLAVETEVEDLKTPAWIGQDGRYPILVIVSTLTGLMKKYGATGQQAVLEEMRRLEGAVRARKDWGACMLCVDDAKGLEKLGLLPVSPNDAWKIKLLLADLERGFAKKGQRVGAVLIVGGDEVVPHHRLPNPADDMDEEVLSDNPYGTLDANYFIPEWPVGRMVDGVGGNVALLLQQLRSATRAHLQVRSSRRSAMLAWLSFAYWKDRLYAWLNLRRLAHLGYTASAWQRSSIAVFRAVASGHSLMVSPPEYAGGFECGRLALPDLGYFNLHGVEGAAEWYGQRDAHDPVGTDYPVALRPCDLRAGEKGVRSVIFSEACYGGAVIGKNEKNSIALRFLALGSRAVVVSTCTSYGSIQLPLMGADLLGQLFWQEVREGSCIGQALLRAKVMLAQKMSRRQGYLDGEDQKTLISFILYGDPLAMAGQQMQKRIKRAIRRPVFSSTQSATVEQVGLSGQVLQQVKAVVEPYLPGMGQAEVGLCMQMHCASQGTGRAKGRLLQQIRTVVTVSKRIEMTQGVHQVYARLTLDEGGEITKVLVSRGGCLLRGGRSR